MRKISVLLSTMVLAAMILAACGGGATSTNAVESPPPVTADSTDDLSGTATEAPTGAATEPGTTTEAPVTGNVNPAQLSNQLDFTVWSQDGEQIGDVNDMVLDLDNTRISYVVVGTGGFLDLGERDILVPWDSLQLQTGSGDTTGGQQNAFILQTDLDVFRNAPDFDLTANLPQMGQAAGDWDIDIRNYWQNSGELGGAGIPATGATIDPNATVDPNATADGTNQGQSTATTEAGQGLATATIGTDQGTATSQVTTTGQGQGQALQGVMLASNLLDATVMLGGQGQGGTGTGQGQATATTDAGVGQATATTDASQGTAAPAGTAESTAIAGTGTDQGTTTATLDDVIVDINETGESGNLLYLVITSLFDAGQRWIPVPFSMFQWDATNNGFILNADAAMLQNAPSFENGQFPDTTTSGWNSEFDAFWQSNGAGTNSGSGSGVQATATP